MIPRRVIILFFLGGILFPSALGLALAGRPLSPLTYLPGTTITNHYTVYGSDYPVKVMVDGGSLFKYVTATEIVDNEFDLIISFPADEYVPPGSHLFGLTVQEEPPSQQGISAQVAVSKKIEVIVYSYEKDIRASLSVPNVNQGSKVIVQLGVQSVGYPDIEAVYGQVTVYDAQDISVGSVTTEKKPLKGLEDVTFIVPFDSDAFTSGNYKAEATVWYDGKFKTANTTFLIGNLDLILGNYTAIFQPGFNEFMVQVTSNWGNPLRNVYAKLFLNGTELIQTPSLDLAPWQPGILKALVKIELPPGTYPGLLRLFFEGEQREIPITLTVQSIEPEIIKEVEKVEKEVQQAQAIGLFPLLITVPVLLLLLGIYLWRRKKGRGRKAREAPRAEEF